ncbi:MAG: A/G-specific adenine glycosylase [Patescibacteria group bacterium]|nr:A/G-specific adenine glycosylase [Candidatus Saccharibacteria bacterium]MDQ5962935.1 A/G-specific adenine glycosylase [Patescibacteria group bacterium]
MQITDDQKTTFLDELWYHYARLARNTLPWRQFPDGQFDAYAIMVSEIMLQQTQATRVITKYQEFLRVFPDVHSLAGASLGSVLRVWQGLGYNRRAKYIWQAAQQISRAGEFPTSRDGLRNLPGIGSNTAGAIMAYTWNRPEIFVETNVRTVLFHHFFPDREQVSDGELSTVLAQLIDHESPRQFYWAMMDYGSLLKTRVRNNSQSRHYTKQGKFEGSKRQIRGKVLSQLTAGSLGLTDLETLITDARLVQVLDDLVSEGLVQMSGNTYSL